MEFEKLANGNKRQLDAWIARFIAGRQVVYSSWPCGRSPESGRYEACTIFENEQRISSHYDQKDYVMVQRPKENWEPHWPPKRKVEQVDGREWVEYYADVEPVPFYTSNHCLYPSSIQPGSDREQQAVEPLFGLARQYVGEGRVGLECRAKGCVATVRTPTMDEPAQSTERDRAVMALAEALFEAETGGSFDGTIVEPPETSLPFLNP